jgi:hypothetical protein
MTIGRERGWQALACLSLVFASACFSPEPPSGSPCADDSRCPKGQKCIAGFCSGNPVVVDTPKVFEDAGIDAPPDGPPPMCINAPDCVNTNTCVTMDCIDNKCVPTVSPDGTQCGTLEAERCCSGTCINISSDKNNCGGCGQKCAVGRICEGVAQTTSCGIKPANTSGRCTCAGANAECPDGQICRTQTPHANRCTPEAVNDCAAGQMFIDVDFCPNFCRYPE